MSNPTKIYILTGEVKELQEKILLLQEQVELISERVRIVLEILGE